MANIFNVYVFFLAHLPKVNYKFFSGSIIILVLDDIGIATKEFSISISTDRNKFKVFYSVNFFLS